MDNKYCINDYESIARFKKNVTESLVNQQNIDRRYFESMSKEIVKDYHYVENMNQDTRNNLSVMAACNQEIYMNLKEGNNNIEKYACEVNRNLTWTEKIEAQFVYSHMNSLYEQMVNKINTIMNTMSEFDVRIVEKVVDKTIEEYAKDYGLI